MEQYKLVKGDVTLAYGTSDQMLALLSRYEKNDRQAGTYEEDQYDIVHITKESELRDIAKGRGFDSGLANSIRIEFTDKYNLKEPPQGLWGSFLSLTGIVKDGTLGRYCPMRNIIQLAEEVDLETIAGTYLHELMHAQQRKTMGLVWYLVALNLFRQLLEKDAMMIEDQYYKEQEQKNKQRGR